jgi:hypothetical protein
MMSHFDYISSHCTPCSPVFCPNTARPAATTALAPNKLDPSGSYLACGARSQQERFSTTLRVVALEVVSFSCPTHDNSVTMLAFFPIKFRPARPSRG